MFGSALDRLTALLDSKFLLVCLLPASLALAAAGLVGWLATGHPLAEFSQSWSRWDFGGQVLAVIVFFLMSFLVASVLAGQSVLITQLFEGYVGPAKWTRALGQRYHLQRRGHMERVGEPDLYLRYPLRPSDVVATRLGNVFRAAETYPTNAYGIDAVVAWPRLFRQLPPEFITDLSSVRQQIDLQLNLALFGVLIATVGSLVLPWLDATTPLLFGTVVVGAVAVAVLSYYAASGSAIAYGQLVRAAFDLHRKTLLTQIDIVMPRLASEERAVWIRLAETWYLGAPRPNDP